MEALLTFLWRFILELWPWTIIDKWQLGLRVRLGKHLTPLKPGVRVLLPFVDTVLTESAALKTVNLTEQTMSTLDGVNASVSGVTWYYIIDLEQLSMKVDDHEEAMSNLAMTALASKLAVLEFSDCTLATLERVAQKKIRRIAKGWGIRVTRFELTDLCDSKVYRIMASGGSQTLVLGSAEE